MKEYNTLVHRKEKMYNKSNAKFMTQIVMVLAGIYCRLVFFFRCRLRNKSDFDYFITDLRLQYPQGEIGDVAIGKLPFFQKMVIVNDELERTCAVKIGHVNIKYSFDKTQKKQQVLLFDDSPRWEIARTLLQMTIRQNHNATVFEFSKHRKEKEDGSVNRKNTS